MIRIIHTYPRTRTKIMFLSLNLCNRYYSTYSLPHHNVLCNRPTIALSIYSQNSIPEVYYFKVLHGFDDISNIDRFVYV